MPGMDVIPVNSAIALRPSTYTDVGGQPMNPSELTFLAARADGAGEHIKLEYGPDSEVVLEGRGQFVIWFTPPEPGVWHWRVTTERGQAYESYFYAAPSVLV